MNELDLVRRESTIALLGPPLPRDQSLWASPPRLLDVRCCLQYEAREEATFLFNFMPARRFGQQIESEVLGIEPNLKVARWTQRDSGNRFLRVIAPPGSMTVTYRALVEKFDGSLPTPPSLDADALSRLPTSTYRYLNPSRYCQSDRLATFARRTFDVGPVGIALVRSVCDWLATSIEYQFETSDTQTTAVDTLLHRAGVCRDFAHLAIAVLRALSIPARYVTGYAWRLDPPDFHALVEAYCGGRWRLFDPTGQTNPDGLVRIGTGLDAAETPFSAFFGNCDLTGIVVSCVGRLPEHGSDRD
jgi:transglutaminase-like putative cysteine protease